jgi:hypothetical protein
MEARILKLSAYAGLIFMVIYLWAYTNHRPVPGQYKPPSRLPRGQGNVWARRPIAVPTTNNVPAVISVGSPLH